MPSSEELLDIIDKNDNVIGTNTRKESKENKTLHRVVCVIIETSSGKIVLQKRSQTCNMPLHWDISAAGHVSSGQGYDEAAKRELFEEVGLDIPLTFISKKISEKPGNYLYFRALYKGIHDGDFLLEDGEVEEVKTFTLDELQSLVKSGEKITPRLSKILEEYYLS